MLAVSRHQQIKRPAQWNTLQRMVILYSPVDCTFDSQPAGQVIPPQQARLRIDVKVETPVSIGICLVHVQFRAKHQLVSVRPFQIHLRVQGLRQTPALVVRPGRIKRDPSPIPREGGRCSRIEQGISQYGPEPELLSFCIRLDKIPSGRQFVQ